MNTKGLVYFAQLGGVIATRVHLRGLGKFMWKRASGKIEVAAHCRYRMRMCRIHGSPPVVPLLHSGLPEDTRLKYFYPKMYW